MKKAVAFISLLGMLLAGNAFACPCHDGQKADDDATAKAPACTCGAECSCGCNEGKACDCHQDDKSCHCHADNAEQNK